MIIIGEIGGACEQEAAEYIRGGFPKSVVAFVAGAGVASLSWQTLLAGVGSLGHRRLSPRIQMLSSVIGNLVVIGFGARILLRLLVR